VARRPRGASSRPGTQVADARDADRPRAQDPTSNAELQIYAATERLLEAESLYELSVGAIIKEAGISRATFYFYFGSKFAVASGLLNRATDEMFATVQPFVNRRQGEPPGVALRASLEAATALWMKHRLILRAAHEHWHAVPDLGALWLGVFDAFTERLAEQFEREAREGLIPSATNTQTMAATLLWATEGCLYVAGLGVDDDLPDEITIVDALSALWIGTLYGRGARATDA